MFCNGTSTANHQRPHYNEPDYYDAPPQPPRPIRVLGATYPQAVTLDSKPEDKPKLLRLPAGSLLSGQLITGWMFRLDKAQDGNPTLSLSALKHRQFCPIVIAPMSENALCWLPVMAT